LDSSSNITKINLNNIENLSSPNLVDLGIPVKKELALATSDKKKKPLPEAYELTFWKECRDVLATFCTSLCGNSPLRYSLTKSISCFDPTVALKSKSRAVSRITTALETFVENNWFSGILAEKMKRGFVDVLEMPLFQENMKNFSISDRLDDLWMSQIPYEDKFSPLRSFLKMVLILFHGNAFVERGFSINREILIENLSEVSLI